MLGVQDPSSVRLFAILPMRIVLCVGQSALVAKLIEMEERNRKLEAEAAAAAVMAGGSPTDSPLQSQQPARARAQDKENAGRSSLNTRRATKVLLLTSESLLVVSDIQEDAKQQVGCSQLVIPAADAKCGVA